MVAIKKGDGLVVDTHLLVAAAKQCRDGVDGEERRLFDCVVSICARVIWTRALSKEALPHLRRYGFRVPQQSALLKELDERGKLRRRKRSTLRQLTNAQRAAFAARGHDDVSDDIPLYEAAASTARKLVITADDNILRRREDLREATGVWAAHVDEVLGHDSSPDRPRR